MIQLSREIRFALTPPTEINPRESANSWSGWPSTNRIVPQLVLRCVVAGHPHPRTGYLCNIKILDDLLREIVLEQFIRRSIGEADPSTEATSPTEQYGIAETMLRTAFSAAVSQWNSIDHLDGQLASLALVINPFLFYSIDSEEPNVIQLTQQFEFSAAHRLHCAELSDEQNRELFGKCNNPSGHGHNYVVEVTIGRHIDARGDTAFQAPDPRFGSIDQAVIPLHQLEATVKQLVIDRLDHQHLNQDVEYFATVNPSVENISIAIFNWLDGQFGAAKLTKIRVYETPKTWAEFAGD